MNDETSRRCRVVDLLSTLVSLDSINPMGRPYEKDQPVERSVIEFIETLFHEHRSRAMLRRQPCSPAHESLILTVSGQSDNSIALFESHIDTVPADEWSDRALNPVVTEEKLTGRGACDDKGSLAAMIVALLEILEEEIVPPRTIELLCAGDEEHAQTGIRCYVDNCPKSIEFAVFGEPTKLSPVVQHKGTMRWDITVHGRSAHTSRPELGVNAVLSMTDVISALQSYQNRLQTSWTNPFMSGPMITVTTIQGGRTRNAIPDECTIAVDFRFLPGMDPTAERETLIEYLRTLDCKITHGPLQLMTPPLSTDPELPFCREVESICRRTVSDDVRLSGEPYGTDASWVSHLCPAIVLGPGDISSAHAVDEYISLVELTQAVEVYKSIMLQPVKQNPPKPIVATSYDANSNGKAIENSSSTKT